MASTTPAPALLYDFLTDLPMISAWANQFPGGVFSMSGGIIAITFGGIGQLQQRHGHSTAEMVVKEIIARCQHYLPYEGTLVRGVMCELLIWLPQASPAVTEAIRYQLCIDVCPLPIPLPDGSNYYPRVLAVAKDMNAGDMMLETIRELELLLYRQTAVNRIPPPSDANATLQARVLAQIAAHELFSYEHFLELTLAHLDLPEPHPRSVFIVGAASTGATRLLTSEALLLESVGYSAITVICHPQNRAVPYYLVCALLSHFLWGMNRSQYQSLLAQHLACDAWLATLFPMLGQNIDPMPIPTNKSVLRRGLRALLRAIATEEYLVAVIQDIHFADEDSRSLLAEVQMLPDHGLRIIASMDPSAMKILKKFQKHHPMVISTQPFTPMLILEYLHEVLPEIATPEAALELHYANYTPYQIKSRLTGVVLAADPASPRPVNTAITLTATATGGAGVRYKFMAGTTMLRDFDTANTFSWKPTLAGTYHLHVIAKDLNSATTVEVTSADLTYLVTPVLSSVTLKATPTSPRTIETPITLTATAKGGAHVQYKFLEGETVLADYSDETTCTWTPNEAKVYQLKVVAKDIAGLSTEVPSAVTSFTITPKLSAIKLSATPGTRVAILTPVKLQVTPSGGASLRYKFLLDGVMLRDFDAAASYTWTPDRLGTYSLTAVAIDANSMNPATEVTANSLSIEVTTGLTTANLATDPISPRTVGTSVKLIATANGGAQLMYRFMAGTTMLRDFDVSNQYIWTPTQPGMYALSVVVKDQNSAAPTKTVTTAPRSYLITSVLSAVSLSTAPQSPGKINTSVTLTAAATGGADVQYQFKVGANIVRNFDSSPTCNWTPNMPGTYTLTVVARDSNGMSPISVVTSTPVSFVVTAPLSGVTLTASPTSPRPINTSILLTAKPVGGLQVEYQFRVAYKDSAGRWQWTTLNSYGAASTFTWKPTMAKTYTLEVRAREAGSTVEYQAINQISFTAIVP